MDEYLDRAATTRPQKTALVDGKTEDTWSYRELSEWAGTVALELDRRGIRTGDRVALVTNRKPEAIATIWGIFRRGGIVVPLDPGDPIERIVSQIERAGVTLCVTGSEAEAAVAEQTTHAISVTDLASVANHHQGDEHPPISGPTRRKIDETRVILFTSGTTGKPTGIRLTGRNLGASAASTIDRLEAKPADRWLLDLPLYHAGGLSIIVRTAMLGATTVLRRSFDAAGMAKTIDSMAVSGVSLVPTMLDRLLEVGGPFESLRFALVGGAATSPRLANQAIDAGIPIFPSYGMTETASGIATATPAEVASNPKTVGRPVRAATLSIIGQDEQSVGAGEIGEIEVSGQIVSPGPIEIEDPTPRPSLRTGDRGYLTATGQLVVTGRIGDLIVTGGENVSPREVETVIRKAWPVSTVAVIGVPDREWGERVAAAIVLEENRLDFDSEGATKTLREQLAAYKIPKTVRVVDSIPRTASDTVDRERLKSMLMETDSR